MWSSINSFLFSNFVKQLAHIFNHSEPKEQKFQHVVNLNENMATY